MELFGHPFSSYTWKVLIALYACEIPFTFRMVDPEHPENLAFVQEAAPLGKFPVLREAGEAFLESSSIIEHLARTRSPARALLPADPLEALPLRTLDRIFDNYVMAPCTDIVMEHIRAPGAPDAARIGDASAKLLRTYAWLEAWLGSNPPGPSITLRAITLLECAAAPALFYADWVCPIPEDCAELRGWRGQLLAHPAIARCVEEARPYRSFFPPGDPGRD